MTHLYCICLPTLYLFCILMWMDETRLKKKKKAKLRWLSFPGNQLKNRNNRTEAVLEWEKKKAQEYHSSVWYGIWARSGWTDGSGKGRQKKGQKLQLWQFSERATISQKGSGSRSVWQRTGAQSRLKTGLSLSDKNRPISTGLLSSG